MKGSFDPQRGPDPQVENHCSRGMARWGRRSGADGGGKWDQLIPLSTPLTQQHRRARAGPVRTRRHAHHFLFKGTGRTCALHRKVSVFSSVSPFRPLTHGTGLLWSPVPCAVPATRTEPQFRAGSRDDHSMAAHTSFCGQGKYPRPKKEAGLKWVPFFREQ